ncbi:MAG: imidazole glycerol phosphate synthase subunit HisH [Bacteroidia bacterium]|nr:imidazole glycerol phosphate synthase subunit HisH [Bacteroidia bacterium]
MTPYPLPVGIVDVGIGNVGSVANMLRKIGNDAIIIQRPDQLEKLNKLILPGVGRFDKGIQALEKMGFIDSIHHFSNRDDTSLLGICLGMQMLFEGSEEGDKPGLGFIPGHVERFKESIQLPIPHVGWTTTNSTQSNLLFSNLDKAFFYFVHAYHAPRGILESEFCLATSEYGYKFPSAVGKGRVMGVQFHPEKSLSFGFQLLRNFVNY